MLTLKSLEGFRGLSAHLSFSAGEKKIRSRTWSPQNNLTEVLLFILRSVKSLCWIRVEVNDRSRDNCWLTEETALMRTADQLPWISIPAILRGALMMEGITLMTKAFNMSISLSAVTSALHDRGRPVLVWQIFQVTEGFACTWEAERRKRDWITNLYKVETRGENQALRKRQNEREAVTKREREGEREKEEGCSGWVDSSPFILHARGDKVLAGSGQAP